MAIQDSFIPATLGYKNPDPLCDLDIVPNVGREQEVNVVVSNTLGFGGHNTVIAFKKVAEYDLKHEEIKDLISQIDSSTIQEFSFQTQADSLYISKIKERQAQTEHTANTSANQQATTNAEATPPAVAQETKSKE